MTVASANEGNSLKTALLTVMRAISSLCCWIHPNSEKHPSCMLSGGTLAGLGKKKHEAHFNKRKLWGKCSMMFICFLPFLHCDSSVRDSSQPPRCVTGFYAAATRTSQLSDWPLTLSKVQFLRLEVALWNRVAFLFSAMCISSGRAPLCHRVFAFWSLLINATYLNPRTFFASPRLTPKMIVDTIVSHSRIVDCNGHICFRVFHKHMCLQMQRLNDSFKIKVCLLKSNNWERQITIFPLQPHLFTYNCIVEHESFLLHVFFLWIFRPKYLSAPVQRKHFTCCQNEKQGGGS